MSTAVIVIVFIVAFIFSVVMLLGIDGIKALFNTKTESSDDNVYTPDPNMGIPLPPTTNPSPPTNTTNPLPPTTNPNPPATNPNPPATNPNPPTNTNPPATNPSNPPTNTSPPTNTNPPATNPNPPATNPNPPTNTTNPPAEVVENPPPPKYISTVVAKGNFMRKADTSDNLLESHLGPKFPAFGANYIHNLMESSLSNVMVEFLKPSGMNIPQRAIRALSKTYEIVTNSSPPVTGDAVTFFVPDLGLDTSKYLKTSHIVISNLLGTTSDSIMIPDNDNILVFDEKGTALRFSSIAGGKYGTAPTAAQVRTHFKLPTTAVSDLKLQRLTNSTAPKKLGVPTIIQKMAFVYTLENIVARSSIVQDIKEPLSEEVIGNLIAVFMRSCMTQKVHLFTQEPSNSISCIGEATFGSVNYARDSTGEKQFFIFELNFDPKTDPFNGLSYTTIKTNSTSALAKSAVHNVADNLITKSYSESVSRLKPPSEMSAPGTGYHSTAERPISTTGTNATFKINSPTTTANITIKRHTTTATSLINGQAIRSIYHNLFARLDMNHYATFYSVPSGKKAKYVLTMTYCTINNNYDGFMRTSLQAGANTGGKPKTIITKGKQGAFFCNPKAGGVFGAYIYTTFFELNSTSNRYLCDYYMPGSSDTTTAGYADRITGQKSGLLTLTILYDKDMAEVASYIMGGPNAIGSNTTFYLDH